MKILAIESSADDTSAAVVKESGILSNVIASQIEIHTVYGGIVPEVAARSHIEAIIPVVERAMEGAKCDWDDIDAIAVTRGPGLLGSLLIGVLAAKTLAIAKDKPLIGVNHIWAHGFVSFLTENKPQFPFLALTVSGGHTTLSLYKEDLTREILGETLDDAAGEAFDKVAKLLGLPYPGGPAISKVAENGDPDKYVFPVAKLGRESLDFSFSGLKTSVLRKVQEITGVNPGSIVRGNPRTVSKVVLDKVSNDKPKKTYELDEQTIADLAASFQKAAVKALVQNTLRANARYQPKSVVVGGGVACNGLLRSELLAVLPEAIFVPPVLCTDNAAMIGAMALQMAERGMYIDPNSLVADSSLED